MNTFSIIIPVYNEQDNIYNLILEIKKELSNLYKYEIIIVDDSSTDQTQSTLAKLNKEFSVNIILNKINEGQSKSILNGIMHAKNDIIITIDGDGQNNPRDIKNLINTFLTKKYDLVAGIRKKRKDNYIKKISSKIANYIRAKYLDDNCSDTGCALKIFNKEIFLEFPFFDGIHRFLPALFRGFGYKIFFVDVDHRFRMSGKSKYGTINRLFKGIKDMFYVKKLIKLKSTKIRK